MEDGDVDGGKEKGVRNERVGQAPLRFDVCLRCCF